MRDQPCMSSGRPSALGTARVWLVTSAHTPSAKHRAVLAQTRVNPWLPNPRSDVSRFSPPFVWYRFTPDFTLFHRFLQSRCLLVRRIQWIGNAKCSGGRLSRRRSSHSLSRGPNRAWAYSSTQAASRLAQETVRAPDSLARTNDFSFLAILPSPRKKGMGITKKKFPTQSQKVACARNGAPAWSTGFETSTVSLQTGVSREKL